MSLGARKPSSGGPSARPRSRRPEPPEAERRVSKRCRHIPPSEHPPSPYDESIFQFLHQTTPIYGRAAELEYIYGRLKTALDEKTSCCLYVSGVPGTGKTASVRQAIRMLLGKRSINNSLLRIVHINGLRLANAKQAYVALLRGLEEDLSLNMSSNGALARLEERFSGAPKGEGKMSLVVLDELDVLIGGAGPSQSLLYNFFDWANRPHSRMVLVAIANTMDLPERMLSNRVSSRMGLFRIDFQPYTHSELLLILKHHNLSPPFEADALEFCARKVAAVSGDARKAVELCQRAAAVARRRGTVSLAAVQTAVREFYSSGSSPNGCPVERLSLHQRLFLVALWKVLSRDDFRDPTLLSVAEMHLQLCRTFFFSSCPSPRDFARILHTLVDCRIVFAESPAPIPAHLVRFVQPRDEVERLLRSFQNDHLKRILAF